MSPPFSSGCSLSMYLNRIDMQQLDVVPCSGSL